MRRTLGMMALAGLLVAFGTGCEKQGQSGGQAEAEEPSGEKSGDKEQGSAKGESGSEHPGDEHAGDEHPGDEKGNEHPGDDHSGNEHGGDEHGGDEHGGESHDEGDVSAQDIIKGTKSYVSNQASDGIFTIEDPKQDGKELKLKFVKVHEPVRKMEGKGYFACTDFHVKGNEDKLYDLDFWMKSKDGKLEVTKQKIHKHPAKKDGEWVKKARYTFKDDEVVELN